MEDTQIIQWVLDNIHLIQSTRRPSKEEKEAIFTIANIVDSTQKHSISGCGRCYDTAKRAIMRNLPTLFTKG